MLERRIVGEVLGGSQDGTRKASAKCSCGDDARFFAFSCIRYVRVLPCCQCLAELKCGTGYDVLFLSICCLPCGYAKISLSNMFGVCLSAITSGNFYYYSLSFLRAIWSVLSWYDLAFGGFLFSPPSVCLFVIVIYGLRRHCIFCSFS
jgi:hypothetical protein